MNENISLKMKEEKECSYRDSRGYRIRRGNLILYSVSFLNWMEIKFQKNKGLRCDIFPTLNECYGTLSAIDLKIKQWEDFYYSKMLFRPSRPDQQAHENIKR